MTESKAARRIIALAAGLALDALLGDPHEWPHPVRLIGKQVELEERLARRYIIPEAIGGSGAGVGQESSEGSESLVAQEADGGDTQAGGGAAGNDDTQAGSGGAAGNGDTQAGGGGTAVRGGSQADDDGTAANDGAAHVGPDAIAFGDAPTGLSRMQAERLAGAAIAADVALLSPIVVRLVLRAIGKANPWLATAVEAVLFYQLVAARSLHDESMAVYRALEGADLEGARRAVGMIVGRDTDSLDAGGIARAAVETVAENTSDGVVAPMLAMALGGAPAALFYKAVNTLDSMMGYKNERYLNLGWAAAKLDDAVNLIPARVSGALMCVAAGLAGFDARSAWRVFKRDRLNHPSPNSAHAEAACAGALGVQLGGPNVYFGEVVDKPTIGDATRPVEAGDIPRANRLMFATAALAALASAGLTVASASIAAPSPRDSRC